MRRALALLVALALAPGIVAQERPELTLEVDPRAATIGDLLTVTVSFELPADHEAILPGEEADLGGAEVRSVDQSVENAVDGGRRYVVRYEAALWEVGETTLTSPDIASRSPDGEVTQFAPAEATVTVRSVLPEGAEEIRDIRGPKEIPLRWHHYAVAALPVIGLLGLLALLVWWVRSRRGADAPETAPVAPLPPAEEALSALRELESEDLVGEGLIKEHYVRLSWILRNYVERRWGLPALEETTGMLRHTMLGSGRVPEAAVEGMVEVLRRADLAKFAKHRPEAETARAEIARVRQIVHATRSGEEVAETAASDETVASPAG
ncbi:MAG: hypothetical protein ACLFU7_04920 [Armatimonadota bacterium]